MTWVEDQTQKRIPLHHDDYDESKILCAMLEEKTGPTTMFKLLLARGSLNDSRIVIHYIMCE